MSFRIADAKALLLAALVGGLFTAVKAQSTNGGQHILFSSPDGQMMSNAPLPMVTAPEPREMPDSAAGEADFHPFSPPMPGPIFSQPSSMLPPTSAAKQDDFRNSMDVRKQMGMLTPAELMSVPTPEQIFGLVEKPADSQKNATQTDHGATNVFGFDTTAITAAPEWTKAWTDDTGKSPASSNTTERASGFLGGFFDNTRNDNRFDGRFGSHDAGSSGTLFGQSQPAGQQSSWDSGLVNGDNTPRSSGPDNAFNHFASPGISPGSDFASQSPFVPQQMSTMGTLPQLPTLQSLPGQNDKFSQPAAAPSWGPKPPPWTTPQTPWGTPIQLNQIR
jgi:hypothetical protein